MTNAGSRPTYVVGVDPGKTCGVAVFDLATSRLSVSLLAPLDACDAVDRLVESAAAASLVACEPYVFTTSTARKTFQPDALEVLGTLRWICRRHGVRFDETQSPASAAKIANRDLLRRIGWHRPGPDHQDRAAAQVLTALARLFPDHFLGVTRPGSVVSD